MPDLPDRRAQLLVTSAIMLQVFLSALDTTIVSTAMPTVVASLGGMGIYSWVFSIYMIASTIATPIAGKLSDQLDRRTMYLASIAAFMLASMTCGLAPSMIALIVSRAFQGMAAGTMFAVSLGLIGLLYPPHQRARLQGFISALWAIASIIGPPLGGYVVDQFSWRWTFYLNLPLGILALVFIYRYLRDTEAKTAQPPIDNRGAILLAILLVGFLTTVTNAEHLALSLMLPILAVTVLLAAAFWRHEQRTAAPVLPIHLWRRTEIAAANLATMTTAVGAFGLIIFAPLYVQGVMLGSARQAGLVLLPLSIAWAIGSFISGGLINRAGYRTVSVTGSAVMFIGFVVQIALAGRLSFVQLMSLCFLGGCGMGMVTNVVTVAVQNAVERHEMGVATSSTIFSRALGAAVGISLLGAILSLTTVHRLQALSNGIAPGTMAEVRSLLLPETRLVLSPERLMQLKHGLSHGLQMVFLCCAFISFVAILVSLKVSPAKPMTTAELSA